MTKIVKGTSADGNVATEMEENSLIDELPNLAEYAQAKSEFEQRRPKYTFKTPPKFKRGEKDPKEVQLVELTSQEEDLAYTAAGNNKKHLTDELVKLSLYRVDGRRVNQGVDEGLVFFSQWSSRFRKLIYAAFSQIHNTTDEEDESFLASMTVST